MGFPSILGFNHPSACATCFAFSPARLLSAASVALPPHSRKCGAASRARIASVLASNSMSVKCSSPDFLDVRGVQWSFYGQLANASVSVTAAAALPSGL